MASDIVDGQVPAVREPGGMTAAQAIVSVEIARNHLDAAADEIVRQINGRAWLSLGFASWDEMREAKYGGAAVIVPREDRPELVARLRAEGLTQRQIGQTVGAGERTVRRDLNRPDDRLAEVLIETSRGSRPATYSPPSQEWREAQEAQAARELHAREFARMIWLLGEQAGHEEPVAKALESWEPAQDIHLQKTTAERLNLVARFLSDLAEEWPAREAGP